MNLYELTKEYQDFMDSLEEIPEEAIEDTLEALQGEITIKVDNTACIIKGLLAEAEAIDAEAKALAERASVKKKAAERLKSYLAIGMERAGLTSLETSRNSIKFAKTPPKVTIADTAAFVQWAEKNEEELLRFSSPTPDKTKIKKYIEEGNEIPGVSIETGVSLRIK